MKFNIHYKYSRASTKYELQQIYYARVLAKTSIVLIHCVDGPSYATLPPFRKHVNHLYFAYSTKKIVSSTYFITVLHPLFWLSILLAYSGLFGFLFIYKRLHKLTFNQFLEITLHAIGVSSENSTFSTISLKFLIVIFLFLFFILGECFSAFLTTELAIATESKLPFNHLENLQKQLYYKICTKQFSHIYTELYTEMKYDHILNTKDCDEFYESLATNLQMPVMITLCNNKHLTVFFEESDFNAVLR